jgi:hypothetical protein
MKRKITFVRPAYVSNKVVIFIYLFVCICLVSFMKLFQVLLQCRNDSAPKFQRILLEFGDVARPVQSMKYHSYT